VALFLFPDSEDQVRECIYFHVVWCGCETLSVNVKEEYKLFLLGKINFGKIFVPKGDEVSSIECYMTRNALIYAIHIILLKGKAIPVPGHGGP
jgi:hypothetical protein